MVGSRLGGADYGLCTSVFWDVAAVEMPSLRTSAQIVIGPPFCMKRHRARSFSGRCPPRAHSEAKWADPNLDLRASVESRTCARAFQKFCCWKSYCVCGVDGIAGQLAGISMVFRRRTYLAAHFTNSLLVRVSILALTARLLAVPACATDDLVDQDSAPAVSSLNAKAGGFGGAIADEGAGGGYLSLAVPLGHRFGLQVDGLAGGGGGNPFYGGGGHLFWRNPAIGLLGAYAAEVRWDGEEGISDVKVGKIGAEAHLYLGQFSLEGLGAYQYGTNEGLAGKAMLAYYPIDDLRLELGVSYLDGPGTIGLAGLEWAAMPEHGVSLFVDGSVNNDDNNARSVLGGLKFYFARENKSLIRRHREDDPDVELVQDLYSGLPSNLFQTTKKHQCAEGEEMVQGECCPVDDIVGGACDGNF